MNKINLILLLFVTIVQLQIHSQNQILLDEKKSDWQGISLYYADKINDQISGNVDFDSLWIFNDDINLYLLLKLRNDIVLQSDNSISLLIDSDNDPSTGIQKSGLGAELEFKFGERTGTVLLSGKSYSIRHFDIGLISAPTVSSSFFEIAIKRAVKFEEIPLFSSDLIRIAFIDNDAGKDQMPEVNEYIEFTFSDSTQFNPLPFSINKQSEDQLRILTYNVLRDNLFEPALRENYSRILNALNPDIIAFQEIYDHTSEETADLMNSILPLPNGQEWHHSKAEDTNPANQYNTDLIVISKYKIKSSFRIEGFYIEGSVEDRANMAVLLDLRPEFNSDMLLINAHPPCCSRDDRRQEEADKIMEFIREAKKEGGLLTLSESTPIIIAGDMNFVRLADQRNTLLTGDIEDNENYGEDFRPDWNNENFYDAVPYTSNLPMVFTWYDENEGFGPGRLDYIIYSASVLSITNSFVLFTPALSGYELETYNLLKDDAVAASDHLPVIADFKFRTILGSKDTPTIKNFSLLQNYPNPFNPSTTISYFIPEKTNVKIEIYDVLGRKTRTLINEIKNAGKYDHYFSARGLPSGIYYYRIQAGVNSDLKKMIVLK